MNNIIDKINKRLNELNEIIKDRSITYKDKNDIEKMTILNEYQNLKNLLEAINFFIKVKMKPIDFEDSIDSIAKDIDNDPGLSAVGPLVSHFYAINEEKYNIVSKQEVYNYIDTLIDEEINSKPNKK